MPSFDYLGEFQLVDFLRDHGYPVVNKGRYLQIPAYWRDGDDTSSVVVYPRDQIAKDFVTGESFDIKELIKRVEKIDEIQFQEKYGGIISVIRKTYEPKASAEKIFDRSILSSIRPIYAFYTDKGVREDILVAAGSGLCSEGKLKNRYVFPIFNCRDQIIGLAGRTVVDSPIKWKLIGGKENWIYPLTLFGSSDSVWIVESIGDYLALIQSGIKHVLVLFGVDMSLAILNELIAVNPGKIFVALNNDCATNRAGNNAATKLNRRLLRYFDRGQIEIKVPNKKDWFEDLIKTDTPPDLKIGGSSR
jgi:hypothetical protein